MATHFRCHPNLQTQLRVTTRYNQKLFGHALESAADSITSSQIFHAGIPEFAVPYVGCTQIQIPQSYHFLLITKLFYAIHSLKRGTGTNAADQSGKETIDRTAWGLKLAAPSKYAAHMKAIDFLQAKSWRLIFAVTRLANTVEGHNQI